MDNLDLVQVNIEISVSDATRADIDLLTRNLLSELKKSDVESAQLAPGDYAPQGTKSGDPVAVGSILISALPTVLPTIVAVVQAWASRGQGRIVKFRGKGIEFEGSPEEFQKLLATLEKRDQRKK